MESTPNGARAASPRRGADRCGRRAHPGDDRRSRREEERVHAEDHDELSDALTRLDEDADLFVGVLAFAGDHTTAGLEMPLFFSEEAKRDAARRKAGADVGAGRSVRARTPAAQAASDGGAGHHVHDRDRDRAGRRHRGGGVGHSFLPVGAQAGPRAARWGDGAVRAARRVGQRDVPPAARGRVRRRRGLPDRTGARGRRARRADRAGDRPGPRDVAVLTAGARAHDRQRPPRARPATSRPPSRRSRRWRRRCRRRRTSRKASRRSSNVARHSSRDADS